MDARRDEDYLLLLLASARETLAKALATAHELPDGEDAEGLRRGLAKALAQHDAAVSSMSADDAAKVRLLTARRN